jgi:hypothetical protein
LVANKNSREGLKSVNYGGATMAQPLSEQLAELSVHAKHAEDALAAAQKEAHEKVGAGSRHTLRRWRRRKR